MVQTAVGSISEMVLPADNVRLWVEQIGIGRKKEDIATIERAAWFAIQAHKGQKRSSGEDYVNHTFAVAAIVHELGLDVEVVVAALLHDAVEDTSVTLEQIKNEFGLAVARLVDGVTKMEVIEEFGVLQKQRAKQNSKAESLRKMMLAMVDDVRVVLIKLCDRLHNMRTLEAVNPEKQKRVANETLDIFAPLANRLGVWQLKWELEDLSFRYIEPKIYKEIASQLSEKRVQRMEYVDDFVAQLKGVLQDNGVDAKVYGRVKHIYSIWSKMQKKHLDFEHIFDVRAVRILVETVQECYTALGVIHTQWKYISGEFDDYIATPKENNYRSIHTAVIGPEGQVIEVQIRTHEMHRYNELGVAAHWRYKEGNKQSDEEVNNKIIWLRQLLEWKEEVADANEFVDRVKDEVFQQRIYVFSPKGQVVDLAEGATPLDFAYAIHTEVGHRCRGAKVNSKMVPLNYQLKTGERVNILTVKEGGPSLDWLDPHKGYIKSKRARARIQHWFRHENREETISHGRAILERELDRMNLHDVSYAQLAKQFAVEDVEELFFKLVDGSIRAGRVAVVAQKLLKQEHESTQFEMGFKKADKEHQVGEAQLTIQGVRGLKTSLAKCCQPVPGDTVLGFVTRGAGVTIHRADCANILYQQNTASERVLEVHWGDNSQQTYPMTILLHAFDRKGLLKDISSVFADEKVNVLEISSTTDKKDQSVKMTIIVEVADFEIMSKLLAKLDQLPNVLSVRRKN